MSDIQTLTHPDEEEISLVDILRFFQRRWRLVGGVTIVLSTLSTVFTLTKPPSYQRSAVLQVKNSPLLSDLLPQMADVNSLGNWASQALTELELDATLTTPAYDATQRQITLSLTALEPELIDATPTSMVLAGLTKQWQKQVQQMLTEQTFLLKVQQEQAEQALGQLEGKLEQVSPNNLPRQEAMEEQRARLLLNEAELAARLNVLTELERNLEETSRDLLPVTIASEGEIVKTQSSLLQTFILSLIAGFMVAVLIAIAVEQWPHLQAELQATESETPGKS